MGPNAPRHLLGRYGTALSRSPDEVIGDLEAYVDLLQRWQRVQNLVSRETLPDVWRRHILDSLQALPLIRPGDRTFLDLGSGGGLPAIPLAVSLKDRPDVHFTLVEPNLRKASFLRTVARELDLAIVVKACRSDEIDSRETHASDVITSRALADLSALCNMAMPFFYLKTQAIFHKGREHVEEIAKARASWQFDVLVVESDTNVGSALLVLKNLSSISDD